MENFADKLMCGSKEGQEEEKEKFDIFLHKIENVQNMSAKKVFRSTTAQTWLIYFKCKEKNVDFYRTCVKWRAHQVKIISSVRELKNRFHMLVQSTTSY
jgi:predicted Ser/Thr protein kinase